MFDINVLNESLTELKKTGSILTNCFFMLDKLKALSEKPESQLFRTTEFVMLLCKEESFKRLYYWIKKPENISDICAIIKNEHNSIIIIELIGKANDLSVIKKIFTDNGIRQYGRLSRYQASELKTFSLNIEGFLYREISKESIPLIPDLFQENFDKYISHLPTIEQLYDLQREHLIYGAYDDKILVGVFCMEKVGRYGLYHYQTVLRKSYQNLGVGIELKSYAIKRNPTCRHWVTWVEDSNKRSIRLNKLLGFHEDGLKTEVLIWGK